MTEFIACVNSTMSNANCVQVALQYVTVIQYFISRSKFRPVWCIGWSSCSTAQEGNGSTISATFHCFQPYKLLYWHASCKLCLLHYKKDLLLPTSYVGEQMWLTVGILFGIFFSIYLCAFNFLLQFWISINPNPPFVTVLNTRCNEPVLWWMQDASSLLFSLEWPYSNMNSTFMIWVST